MNRNALFAGAALVAAISLTLALPGRAADPEPPACGEGEVSMWVPHGEVDPARTKACQA